MGGWEQDVDVLNPQNPLKPPARTTGKGPRYCACGKARGNIPTELAIPITKQSHDRR